MKRQVGSAKIVNQLRNPWNHKIHVITLHPCSRCGKQDILKLSSNDLLKRRIYGIWTKRIDHNTHDRVVKFHLDTVFYNERYEKRGIQIPQSRKRHNNINLNISGQFYPLHENKKVEVLKH